MFINTNKKQGVGTKDRTKSYTQKKVSLSKKHWFLKNRGYDIQRNEVERIHNLYELYFPKKMPPDKVNWKMWKYTNAPHHKAR